MKQLNEYTDVRFLLGNLEVVLDQLQIIRELSRVVKQEHYENVSNPKSVAAEHEMKTRPHFEKMIDRTEGKY